VMGALAALAWVALASAQGRGGQGRDAWADNLPPGQAKELAVQRCSTCHTLERTVQLRKARDGWETTVYDMVGRGAPIFLDEANDLIAYFSDVFGPNAPPFVDVNRASRDELVKLPGITSELADKLIAYRQANGPLASRDKIRDVLGFDEQAFEKLRYYVGAAAHARTGATVVRPDYCEVTVQRIGQLHNHRPVEQAAAGAVKV